jgi:glycine hydroxymethyltransferase
MDYKNLIENDKEVFSILEKEEKRQNEELELIASENYISPSVLEAMSTIFANKYSEGYSGKRYYGGNKNIDELENLAILRAKNLFQLSMLMFNLCLAHQQMPLFTWLF